jgi:hypothetical protein
MADNNSNWYSTGLWEKFKKYDPREKSRNMATWEEYENKQIPREEPPLTESLGAAFKFDKEAEHNFWKELKDDKGNQKYDVEPIKGKSGNVINFVLKDRKTGTPYIANRPGKSKSDIAEYTPTGLQVALSLIPVVGEAKLASMALKKGIEFIPKTLAQKAVQSAAIDLGSEAGKELIGYNLPGEEKPQIKERALQLGLNAPPEILGIGARALTKGSGESLRWAGNKLMLKGGPESELRRLSSETHPLSQEDLAFKIERPGKETYEKSATEEEYARQLQLDYENKTKDFHPSFKYTIPQATQSLESQAVLEAAIASPEAASIINKAKIRQKSALEGLIKAFQYKTLAEGVVDERSLAKSLTKAREKIYESVDKPMREFFDTEFKKVKAIAGDEPIFDISETLDYLRKTAENPTPSPEGQSIKNFAKQTLNEFEELIRSNIKKESRIKTTIPGVIAKYEGEEKALKEPIEKALVTYEQYKNVLSEWSKKAGSSNEFLATMDPTLRQKTIKSVSKTLYGPLTNLEQKMSGKNLEAAKLFASTRDQYRELMDMREGADLMILDAIAKKETRDPSSDFHGLIGKFSNPSSATDKSVEETISALMQHDPPAANQIKFGTVEQIINKSTTPSRTVGYISSSEIDPKLLAANLIKYKSRLKALGTGDENFQKTVDVITEIATKLQKEEVAAAPSGNKFLFLAARWARGGTPEQKAALSGLIGSAMLKMLQAPTIARLLSGESDVARMKLIKYYNQLQTRRNVTEVIQKISILADALSQTVTRKEIKENAEPNYYISNRETTLDDFNRVLNQGYENKTPIDDFERVLNKQE